MTCTDIDTLQSIAGLEGDRLMLLNKLVPFSVENTAWNRAGKIGGNRYKLIFGVLSRVFPFLLLFNMNIVRKYT